ncbi:phage/plasmid primase, P4 family [Bradyrhizobium sp. CCGB12]|uniref:phage/plasmid primase, P4 family n=1 Tax=Bradyrhizobium sp. CCGB12 TaxID=2949632 RepID=UPI0020B3D668|nr:phage/plasmid primase, P4 family [Bradyrhizobium sp. CCGB12]MCP3388844.1 phage/plasmid primase, P4 family [Bradyrhizobium sp. CCGB12]
MNVKPHLAHAVDTARPALNLDDVVAEVRELERVVTQDGIARVFARRFAGRLRYCHHTEGWYCWRETHWQRDETKAAFEFVRVLAREVSEKGEARDLKEIRKTAFASGVDRFSRSDPALAVTSERWDLNPFLLGTPKGTVDLRSGRLRPGEPDDGITKVTAIGPANTADCPQWRQFIYETTNGNDGLARFLQQWTGYCLTGDISEHALFFGHGDGGNGKGIFVNTVNGIMANYAAVAPPDTFTASQHDRHPAELAMLRGARLVTASETEKGRAWAENRIKQLTGGDPITARFMRGNFFTFQPTFKLTIIGNHQPTLENVDASTRRRFNIIPFEHKPQRPDPHLMDRLRSEWPAILRWMIDGCLDWQRSGLVRPGIVLEATAEYFEEQDLFGHWLAACCETVNPAAATSTSLLYDSWKSFAVKSGEKPGSHKAFGTAMEKRGFKRGRSGTSRFFRGVRLSLSDALVTHDAL